MHKRLVSQVRLSETISKTFGCHENSRCHYNPFSYLFLLGAHTQFWKQYADSAQIYRDQKNIDRSIKYFSKAKEGLKRDSALTNTYVEICNNLANLFGDIDQYEKAEPLFFGNPKD